MTLTTEDQILLAMMPFHIQDVEDIVNERGPKTTLTGVHSGKLSLARTTTARNIRFSQASANRVQFGYR